MKSVLFRIAFFLYILPLYSQYIQAQVPDQAIVINEHQTSLRDILRKIEQQTPFLFLYNETLLDMDQKVSSQLSSSDIRKVLNAICEPIGIQYEIVNNIQILLMPKKENADLLKYAPFISGYIMDEKGSPLEFVSVMDIQHQEGTLTDENGYFQLPSQGDSCRLTISHLAYKTIQKKFPTSFSLRIQMIPHLFKLDEVVAVGYGTLEKRQITSAITSLSAKDMMEGVGGSDISAALQGKIAGLVMVNNGSTNAETVFQLRGMTSINAGKSPLIVIDGFPGGDIRSLNQADIQSIDVLKDASAGAIYGTRAASGVILITTKRGSDTNGKVKLTYSAELSRKQDYHTPQMLSAAEYVEHGIGIDYGGDVDWWEEMIDNGNLSQKHHLALEMGTEKAQVYTSFFYENNEGIAIRDSRKDYGGRINGRFKLFDNWLEIHPDIGYRQVARIMNFPNFQQALRNNPTRSPYDPDSETGYNIWVNESLDYNVLADALLADNQVLDKWFKPEITMRLNIKTIPGLFYEQLIGYENHQWERHEFRSRDHRQELQNSRKGWAKLSFDKIENLSSEGYVTYMNDFEGSHSLNAVAGYSYFERNGENFNVENYNFPTDQTKYWDIGKGSFLSDGKAGMSSGKNITERLLSFFVRVNYAYQDKYMVTASIRHEGSSKFAADNRWGDFWAVSGGWRISNEHFMKDIAWVDDLKVRFGYGVTGNNDFSADYMANILSSDQYWMLPNGEWAYSYGKGQNVNNNLGWEEKKEWNLGVDYSFFGNRLYGKFDYYRRKIDNLIYSVKVPQPPYTNGTQWQNIGSMESKGWEFEVGGDVIRTKDFTWTSSLNLSQNKGKILTLWGNNTYYDGYGFPAPGSPGSASRMAEYSAIGSFYMWKFSGFDEAGKFLLYNKKGEVIPASEKTENDKQFMGNYIPTVMLGWNHTVSYKNWDLGINMRSWIGFDVYNTINMYFGIQGVDNCNVLKDAYGKFDPIRGEKQICDYYLEDGSFLKIDAITFGYSLPLSKYTQWIDRLRVYGTVGNVCTIAGYSGLNPEVDIVGWDRGIDAFWQDSDASKGYPGLYPQVRTYTFGLQVTF